MVAYNDELGDELSPKQSKGSGILGLIILGVIFFILFSILYYNQSVQFYNIKDSIQKINISSYRVADVYNVFQNFSYQNCSFNNYTLLNYTIYNETYINITNLSETYLNITNITVLNNNYTTINHEETFVNNTYYNYTTITECSENVSEFN